MTTEPAFTWPITSRISSTADLAESSGFASSAFSTAVNTTSASLTWTAAFSVSSASFMAFFFGSHSMESECSRSIFILSLSIP